MKMKQISDSTIKITIQLEDLEERGMEIADILVPQEQKEEFDKWKTKHLIKEGNE